MHKGVTGCDNVKIVILIYCEEDLEMKNISVNPYVLHVSHLSFVSSVSSNMNKVKYGFLLCLPG